MGKVKFKEGQPVQALSGRYCDAEFRTLANGQTIVHLWKPTTVVERCVAEIQSRMGDIRDATDQRRAIEKRVRGLYKKYRKLTSNEAEQSKYILQAYFNTRRRLPSRDTGKMTELEYEESS